MVERDHDIGQRGDQFDIAPLAYRQHLRPSPQFGDVGADENATAIGPQADIDLPPVAVRALRFEDTSAFEFVDLAIDPGFPVAVRIVPLEKRRGGSQQFGEGFSHALAVIKPRAGQACPSIDQAEPLVAVEFQKLDRHGIERRQQTFAQRGGDIALRRRRLARLRGGVALANRQARALGQQKRKPDDQEGADQCGGRDHQLRRRRLQPHGLPIESAGGGHLPVRQGQGPYKPLGRQLIGCRQGGARRSGGLVGPPHPDLAVVANQFNDVVRAQTDIRPYLAERPDVDQRRQHAHRLAASVAHEA